MDLSRFVDNQLGYAVNNCVACCIDCNRAKRTRNYDDYVSWVLCSAEHLKEGGVCVDSNTK